MFVDNSCCSEKVCCVLGVALIDRYLDLVKKSCVGVRGGAGAGELFCQLHEMAGDGVFRSIGLGLMPVRVDLRAA